MGELSESAHCIAEPEVIADDCVAAVSGYLAPSQGMARSRKVVRLPCTLTPNRPAAYTQLNRRKHVYGVRQHIRGRVYAINPAGPAIPLLQKHAQQVFQPGANPSKLLLLLQWIAAMESGDIRMHEPGKFGFQVANGLRESRAGHSERYLNIRQQYRQITVCSRRLLTACIVPDRFFHFQRSLIHMFDQLFERSHAS